MNKSDAMKAKIEKLLAKAEGTDNENERETYTAKAERLMLQWGIEAADLEARGEVKPEEVVEVRKTWETTYAIAWVQFSFSIMRGMGNLRGLKSGAKSRHSFYAIGHKTDVENFWTLMNSLELQATAAVNQWWKTAPEREWGLTSRENYKARREFILAYGAECGRRLKALRAEVQQDATPGAALVLVSKQDRVDNWVADQYPSLRQSRSMSSGVGGWAAGREAGSKANLGGKSVGSTGTTGISA